MTTSAVSLDLTKAFDTVSYTILGSLSNDDGAATRTAKKIDLLSKKQLCTCSTLFFYISLPLLHEYDVKMPNFTFYVGSENKTTIFFFLL